MYDKEEFNKGKKTKCVWADFTVNTDFAFPVKMGDFPVFLDDISKYVFVFLYQVPFAEEPNHLVCYISSVMCYACRSQWPRGLRRRSAAARLLRLWVRITPGAWMFV